MSGAVVDMPPADFVVSLCREAGRLCLERRSVGLAVRQKGEVDLVTEVDLALEKLIGESIRSRYPEHAVVSEEGWQDEAAPEADYVWLVDPLDGTTNYVHGYPMFCTSVALSHRGEVLLGCVFDPLHDELFYAEKGKGATLNGKRIRASEAETLISSILSTGFPYDRVRVPEHNAVQLGKLINRIQGVRRSGSLALDLAYVAAGRLDGHWEYRVKPWDTAAGGVLVKEAGGRVSGGARDDWNPFDSDIVATNGRIHDELLAVLGQDM